MAGGSREFLFGRNEPGLIAYHNWLERAMDGAPAGISPNAKTKEVA